ncbi:MAG: MSCRAMM family protein [Myxococcota bacterium]
MLRVATLVCVLASVVSWAQAAVSSTSPVFSGRTDELAQVRFRYGVAIRNGTESDAGPGLSYSGVSPNDLAFTGWLWFLLGDHLGLTAGLQREGFSLLDSGSTVTSGGLLRAFVGPTGRVRFGPARLEAAAAYAFQQLPVFGTVSTPSFATVQRHGVLVAARGLVDLGPVRLEARFEYPFALATVGRPATSRGLGVGGGVRVQLFRTAAIKWGLLADVQWHQDSLTTTDATSPLASSQSVVRAGAALDLQWKEPANEVAPPRASVRVRVRSAEGPLERVNVSVSAGASTRELLTDHDGLAGVAELEPGEVVARAVAAGFEPAEVRATLVTGEQRALELVLSRERPKVGGLVVRVSSLETKGPVKGASVELNGVARETDADGALVLEGLPPGPVAVKVSAAEFTTAEEAAAIVAGTTSELQVVLVPAKKRVPATLSGLVRSARGGRPIAAQLEIRELKQTIAADEAGAFSVQIPGGRYTVRISAPKFVPQTKAVTVRDGDQAIFNVDLAPR